MFSWNINGCTKEKKKIEKIKGVRTFKFGDGNELNSLYKVILPCVIADIEVSIITDVVNSDIPLLLSKDAVKRAGTCLNFEDDSVTMLKKKIPLSCTSSGDYYIAITKPLPDKRKFKYIPFIKESSSKNTTEKIKIATKLHRQFSHPSSKKLCDLVKNAGGTDPEFIKILQTFPNSCKLCIRYKKTEPKPINGNFNMVSVTSGSPQLKHSRILGRYTNYWWYSINSFTLYLVWCNVYQSQLVDHCQWVWFLLNTTYFWPCDKQC